MLYNDSSSVAAQSAVSHWIPRVLMLQRCWTPQHVCYMLMGLRQFAVAVHHFHRGPLCKTVVGSVMFSCTRSTLQTLFAC